MPSCNLHPYIGDSCKWCMLSSVTARTQKGKGIRVLQELFYSQALRLAYIFQKLEHVDTLGDYEYPYFARPAPSEPKHGYIDSRIVKTPAECKKLLKQVLEDDPGGELLLCKFLEQPQYNIVWTPTSLTIGKGHDGATAGKNTVCVPLAGAIQEDLSHALKMAGVGPKQQPYIEAVQPKNSYVVLTQLRAGPAVPIGDYVPKETLVTKVIKADPEKYKDREWEIEMEGLKGTKGLVVWHPKGSMTSHFAIHAFANKIPILFGEKPKVGDVLKPSDNAKAAFDPQAMLAGIIAGGKLKLSYGASSTGAAVNTLLLGVHNSTVMTGEHSKWVGMAAALMLRLGSTALAGEARHLPSRVWPDGKPGRSQVYDKVLNDSLHRHRAKASRLVNVFRYGNWGGSFGGMKWAYCGVATVALFQAVKNLAKNPTEETAAEVVKTLNVAVNQAHNGGWWLNKFVGGDAFDAIQQGNLLSILHCVDIVYRLERVSKAIKPAYLNQQVAKMAAWPETTLKPPAVRSAKLTYQPGIASFSIELFTRLLGSKGKTITAKFPDGVSTDIGKLLANNTYLLRTSEGYAVEMRDGDKNLVVWKDEPITEKALTQNKGKEG